MLDVTGRDEHLKLWGKSGGRYFIWRKGRGVGKSVLNIGFSLHNRMPADIRLGTIIYSRFLTEMG